MDLVENNSLFKKLFFIFISSLFLISLSGCGHKVSIFGNNLDSATSDPSSVTLPPVVPPVMNVNLGVVTTFAGTVGVQGSADGTGTAATFNQPGGVVADSLGNLYVSDFGTNTIRKITPAGVVTTFAGTPGVVGSTDGTGAAASFYGPARLAFDSAKNLYVSDSGNNTIRKITPAGVVTTIAGQVGVDGSTDGTGTAARFNSPFGLAIDSSDNIYVADIENMEIRKITPAGVVTTFAGAVVRGSTDGTGAAARFNSPVGLAIDSSNNLYVSEIGNNTIRKITPAGVVTTFAGQYLVTGSTDGTGTAARFNSPVGLAIDSSNNLYVADGANSTIRKITSAGVVTTFAGQVGVTVSSDGTGTGASFNIPYDIGIDSNGILYVPDLGDATIRKIQ